MASEINVVVGGVRASGSGYPVAVQTLRILREYHVARVIDHGAVLAQNTRLWSLGRNGWMRGLWKLLVIAVRNVRSLGIIVLRTGRRHSIVYVPYPSVFFLLACSFLPIRFRPKCIADAYISIWDATCNDRSQPGTRRLLEGMIRWVESRALASAYRVVCDTEANKRLLVNQLGLNASRVRSIPLAIDEQAFLQIRTKTLGKGPLKVLFFGTMIPLHGIGKLLQAAKHLENRTDVHFRVIGEGQVSKEFERSLLAPNVSWERRWLSLDELAQEIASADICLGVFGGEGKAARVLPLKIYYALAAGKPIISQAELSTPEGVPQPPIFFVDQFGPNALADAIVELAADEVARRRLGTLAAQYFDEWLAPKCIAEAWRQVIGSES